MKNKPLKRPRHSNWISYLENLSQKEKDVLLHKLVFELIDSEEIRFDEEDNYLYYVGSGENILD